MHRKAPLPFICVKSNQPAKQWLKRDLHSYFRHATIDIALSEEWIRRRKQRMLLAWAMLAGGAAMTVLGMAIGPLVGPNPHAIVFGLVVFLVCGGLVIAMIGPVYGLTVCKLVEATKMTNAHIWIKGVHPAFLDRLPEFRG